MIFPSSENSFVKLLSLLHCDVHGRRVRGHVDLGHHVEDEHLLHAGGRHEDVEHVLDVVEGVDELLHDLGHGLEDRVVVDRGQRGRQRDQVLE